MLIENFVCKFFQTEVHGHVGPLTRPVTADHTHHDAGHNKYRYDDEDDLDHSSVPLILPSMMLIAIAEMNMPVSMYNRSIQICMCLMLFFI